ncbi:MAG: CpsB/CapC family capsule biosynthesis tyrosine phosphatase [Gemmatimonadaceae bacterium]
MNAGGGTDFHSHLIPGVDDGAATIEESRAAVAAFARDGISTLIITPHFEGSLTLVPRLAAERLERIDAGWTMLTGDAAVSATGVRLLRGVELMLDVPDPDVRDERLRLGGSRFVLVEYPSMLLPEQHAEYAMRRLRDQGVQPILAHPERYQNVGESLDELLPLRYTGAYFQVNAGSLLGHHGRAAARRAEALLARGWVEYASSDHHARGALAVREARAWLVAHGGAEQAETLFAENPSRILRNESPMSVAPLPGSTGKARPWWARLLGR